MAHVHNVYDTDKQFSINPITRVIKNETALKTMLIQGDHNSERFSFFMPRYIDGHDMTLCTDVDLHYNNIDALSGAENKGVYEVKDLQIDKDDAEKVVFSWLVSENATKHVGTLGFLILFKCVTGDVVDYKWHTGINKEITIGTGMDNGEVVAESFPDILAQWKAEIFGDAENAVANINLAEQSALEAVQTEGAEQVAAVLEAGENSINAAAIAEQNAKNVMANAIKGHLKGEVVTADDVSPVEHEMVVNVHGKNLWNIYETENTSALAVNPDGTITVAGGKFYCPTGKTFSQFCPSLKIGDVVTFTINTTGAPYIYLDGIGGVSSKKTLTITEDILSSEVVLYGAEQSVEDYNEPHTINSIQIEYGNTATEYTPYIDPATVRVTRYGSDESDNVETYTPSSDGTVSGMMSTAPNMTILTDTEGVVIECEYIVDTKTYIDKKFAELQAMIQG